MKVPPALVVAAVFLGLLAGCGDDDSAGSPTPTATATAEPTTSPAPTAEPTPTAGPTPTEPVAAPTPTTGVPTLEQPAIWPAPDVVFETPEDAAADFVTTVFGVPAELGDFQQGDSRSGEIEVLPPAETGGRGAVRSLLLLRQLGPDNGWFVLAAVNTNNSITSPESMTEVPAGPVEVSGMGRGFEGTLILEAYLAGDADNLLDQQIDQGGSTEATQPYSVTLDLSAIESGRTVLLLVKGGVGLETDPGEFSAIPVVIG